MVRGPNVARQVHGQPPAARRVAGSAGAEGTYYFGPNRGGGWHREGTALGCAAMGGPAVEDRLVFGGAKVRGGGARAFAGTLRVRLTPKSATASLRIK
jgi:hypothetical protein